MNQCQLMGRLVRDPELKYTPQGTAVTSFTLAVDRRFNRDKADYINIIAWRQTAEFVAKHFAKGQRVAVVGSIQTRSWEDNDGGKHKAVEIVADSVYFADAKKGKRRRKLRRKGHDTRRLRSVRRRYSVLKIDWGKAVKIHGQTQRKQNQNKGHGNSSKP